MKPVEPASLDAIELSTPEFWEKSLPEREGAFLKLRREDPIRKFKEISRAAAERRPARSARAADRFSARSGELGAGGGGVCWRVARDRQRRDDPVQLPAGV
jgi:hypothetical protein